MKHILIFAICFIVLPGCTSHRKMTIQATDDFSYLSRWKQTAAGAGLMAVSGACYGIHETVVHHPNRIPASWDKQWWDGRISWKNKGSSTWGRTIGSFGSDAKHTFGPLHRHTLYAGAVVITVGSRRRWWEYGLDALVSFVSFSAGFHATYSLYFRE